MRPIEIDEKIKQQFRDLELCVRSGVFTGSISIDDVKKQKMADELAGTNKLERECFTETFYEYDKYFIDKLINANMDLQCEVDVLRADIEKMKAALRQMQLAFYNITYSGTSV